MEEIVGLAETLTPIGFIYPGGIGKTSIVLTVFHPGRIKEQFGHNRRFIRCDEFPASCAHFLSQLSKVNGAGVDNPEGLVPLRPFLFSREIILVLDNAESILDPEGANSQEIHIVVEELSQFGSVCLCVTSRISTFARASKFRRCRWMLDATPSTASTSPDGLMLIDRILKQLDFHPLSITLLATVAHHNRWTTDRLSREWEGQWTEVLRTQHDASLAMIIRLSLSSPMFQELGSGSRELLGVVALFPQGIGENNLDSLFPTLPDRMNTLDNFCALSLTYQSNGFIMTPAPLRDYLRPKDPISSVKPGTLVRISWITSIGTSCG